MIHIDLIVGDHFPNRARTEITKLLLIGFAVVLLSSCAFTPNTPTPTLNPTQTISLAPPTLRPTATISLPTLTFTPIPDTPTPTLTLTLIPDTPTPTLFTGKDGMNMVYVPAGVFLMGSDADAAMAECQKFFNDCQKDWFTNEEPPHSVELQAFWIDQTEVTNAQHDLCVLDGACQSPSWRGYPHNNSPWERDLYYNRPKFADLPVIAVSWNDADSYCRWAGRRLPTEAEWEKAARGTDGRIYPWGDQSLAGNLVNFCDKNCDLDWKDANVDDGYIDTAPVGSYPAGASPYGALDMAGNVWEWVADWYGSDYYLTGPTDNPPGPSSGEFRVVRGGSWYDNRLIVRTVRRDYGVPTENSYSVGFRCALSP